MKKEIFIPVKQDNFDGASTINIQVGTNGLCGGDMGHGSRTYFKFVDLSGTCIKINKLKNGFEIFLAGDSELINFKNALKFACETLEDMIYDNNFDVKKIKDSYFEEV